MHINKVMNIQNLKHYIENIDKNKPINLQRFIGLVEQLSLFHTFQPSDISARKVKGQLYQVISINDDLYKELRKLVNDIGWDRISSSRQNRSHQDKVDGSLLLVRENNSHPNVVLFDKEGHFKGINRNSCRALLIENRQNFISIDKTLAFLKKKTDLNFETPIDIIFADGNEISNSLHRCFFDYYKKLYLFFDLDLGGLTIAKNMNALLPNIPKEFLVPKDIEVRLQKIIEKQSTEYIDKVIKIGCKDQLIAPYAKLIKDYQRILEQESYLYDY
jgi:5S rRNA maturation endonuclease (ribonuclease M5)